MGGRALVYMRYLAFGLQICIISIFISSSILGIIHRMDLE